jgi:cytochrome o ubiquinol oxidase operon protein cyoD
VSPDQRAEIRRYIVGYSLSLLFTGAAFAAVCWQTFEAITTLGIIFALGLAQVFVHFRFFLHIGLKRSARDDLQLILFSAVIIALMVSGTLVILFNLRERMM